MKDLNENIEQINKIQGYDVVIVCTTNVDQEKFWQNRLEQTRGQIIPTNGKVVVVHEDWVGGAGNGLGTLYAYQKAIAKAKTDMDYNLPEALSNGASFALFHTAGKGTRLAPLPGSEGNNKPGVKLPAVIRIGDSDSPLTILEAVIKQTGVYAQSRRGRLSVFWGDQVFIPSVPTTYTPKHHVDILCKLGPMMSAGEWEEKGMHKYGLIAVNKSGNAAQVEKVTHEDAVRLLESFGDLQSVGVSLGSFSMSAVFTEALLKEYDVELKLKVGKLDSDPHFWMPMTLELSSYADLLSNKGIDFETAEKQYERMGEFVKQFKGDGLGLFGAVDVGIGCYWWDYGQIKLYKQFNSLMTEHSEEAASLRKFFGLKERVTNSTLKSGVKCCDRSCVVSSNVSGSNSSIVNSVVSNSNIGEVDISDSLLINVTAKKVVGKNVLLYNVIDSSKEGIVLEDNTVMAHVFTESGEVITMKSSLGLDSGKHWKTLVLSNSKSFEEIFFINKDASLEKVNGAKSDHHRRVKHELVV